MQFLFFAYESNQTSLFTFILSPKNGYIPLIF